MKTGRLLLTAFGLMVLLAGCGSSRVVTLDEYNRVSEGMPYSQVVEIVGAEGEPHGSSTFTPGPGSTGAAAVGYTTQDYIWRNSDGSNMFCMFRDGKVLAKAQLDLDK